MNETGHDIAAAPESLSAGIYEDLRVLLASGRLRPGDTLSIRKLAAEYGVSAMPVREALTEPGVISVRAFNSLFAPMPLQSVRLLRPDGSEVGPRDLDVVVQNNQTDLTFLGAFAKGTWKRASGWDSASCSRVTLRCERPGSTSVRRA